MGVCLCVMLTGLHPCDGPDIQAIMRKTREPLPWERLPWSYLSDPVMDLLNKMLTVCAAVLFVTSVPSLLLEKSHT